jgi:hypothetical protein
VGQPISGPYLFVQPLLFSPFSLDNDRRHPPPARSRTALSSSFFWWSQFKPGSPRTSPPTSSLLRVRRRIRRFRPPWSTSDDPDHTNILPVR